MMKFDQELFVLTSLKIDQTAGKPFDSLTIC